MRKRLRAVTIAMCVAAAPFLHAASLYVSNETSGQVNYYDLNSGVLQGTVGTYSLPAGLANDGAGNLYITAFGENKVYKVNTSTGAQSTFVTLPVGSAPFSLAFDGLGNAYITCRDSGVVSKYAPDGTLLGSVSIPRARGIAYSPVTGNLYVVSTPFSDLGQGMTDSVVLLTTSLSATTFATSNLNNPRYTAIDSAGRVFVSNGQGGRVLQFASDGTYQGEITSSANGANQMSLTSGGYPLYVSQYFADSVLKCTAANSCSVFVNEATGAGTHGVIIAPAIGSSSCEYSLSATGRSFVFSGGNDSVAVSTLSGCSWTATANAQWINIASGSSGTGSGTVSYSVAANTGAARIGTMTIAGQTFTITQGAPCTIQLTPSSASFGSSAATGSLNVSASCAWSAVSNASSFITITSGGSGSGNGVVNYSITANGGATARSGTINVNGQLFTITQNPPINCTSSLSSTSQSFTSAGGAGTITVSTAAGCGWTASSNSSFLAITSGANGNVNGLVNYSVAVNSGGSRAGTLIVAGQTFTVNQSGGCAPSLAASSAAFLSSGSTAAEVSLSTACAWSATANSSFLHILSGSSTGNGSAVVRYSVDPNQTGSQRSGTLTIAGFTLNITQGAPSCTGSISLSAASQSLPSSGGSRVIAVNAASGCNWSAASNSGFLAIQGGASGSGNGEVTVGATSNPSTTAARSGTVTIAGETVTFYQPASEQFGCSWNAVQAKQVRLESMTELVPDFALSCSGAAAQAITGDVVVQFLNTNGTSRRLDNLTSVDAVLLINDPSTPELNVNAFLGAQIGNDTVRFPNVPLAVAGANVTKTFRMKNLRVDASALNSGTGITARVQIETIQPGIGVAVINNQQTVATAVPSITTSLAGAVSGSRTTRRVSFVETLGDGLRSRTGESGYTHGALGAKVGTAGTGTRLIVELRSIPAGVKVLAPVFPDGNANAQLLVQDALGAGLGFQTGTYQELAVVGGTAVAAWEVLSSVAGTETISFTMAFENASVSMVDQIPVRMRLAPVSGLGTEQAVPRFYDPEGAVRSRVNLRVKAYDRRTNLNTGGTPVTCATCRTIELQATASNDTGLPLPATTIVGNFSQGTYFSGTCDASDGGGNCEGGTPAQSESLANCRSCRNVVFRYPSLSPGQSATASLSALLDDAAPNGSLVTFDVSGNNGITTATDTIRRCFPGFGTLAQPAAIGATGTLRVYACDAWALSSNVPWITFGTTSGSGNTTVSYTIQPNTASVARSGQISVAGVSLTIVQPGPGPGGLRFVPMTPCRILDTRPQYAGTTWTGLFGPPILAAGSTRTIPVTASPNCSVPATAKAFVFNVTLDTQEASSGPVDFVTIWPTGDARPNFYTARTSTGGYIANSAIVKAGTGGSVNVYVSNNVHLLLDLNGYFTEDSGLLFYPVNPCRAVDTRSVYSTLPQPYGRQRFNAQETRTFRLPGSPGCQIPAASAYSLQMTIVPGPEADGPRVDFLTAWPAGQGRPQISNMNAYFGYVSANSGIIPAQSDGSISVYANNATNVIIDVNGYFAADDGTGRGLYYYTVPQCRLINTMETPPAMTAAADRVVRIAGGVCPDYPASAKAWALNAWVVPNGVSMPFLSMWPAGTPWPNVSQLNAFQGQTIANSAIVPVNSNAEISVRVNNTTQVAIEATGYFSRP